MTEPWHSFSPEQLRGPQLAALMRFQSRLSLCVGIRRLAVHALALLSGLLAFELQWPGRVVPPLSRASRESWVIFAVVVLAAALGEVLYARRLGQLVRTVSCISSDSVRTPDRP